MAATKTARVLSGIGLYLFALAIFAQAYFFFWNVFPPIAALSEGLGLTLPTYASVLLEYWHFLGMPVFLLAPALLGVAFLPEKHFVRLSVGIGVCLVAAQILLSCFFISMQMLNQTWFIFALEKFNSNA